MHECRPCCRTPPTATHAHLDCAVMAMGGYCSNVEAGRASAARANVGPLRTRMCDQRIAVVQAQLHARIHLWSRRGWTSKLAGTQAYGRLLASACACFAPTAHVHIYMHSFRLVMQMNSTESCVSSWLPACPKQACMSFRKMYRQVCGWRRVVLCYGDGDGDGHGVVMARPARQCSAACMLCICCAAINLCRIYIHGA